MTIVARDDCGGGYYLWGVSGPQAADISPEGDGFQFSTYAPDGNKVTVSNETLESIHNKMCFGEVGAILVMEAGIIVCNHCQRQYCRIKEEISKAQNMRAKEAKLAAFYSRLGTSVVTSN